MSLYRKCMCPLVVICAVALLGCGAAVPGTGDDGSPVLCGKVSAPAGAAQKIPQTVSAEQGHAVIAQSNDTGRIYRGLTDESGEFQIDIPDDEAGNTFVVTILGPDGRALGPVVFDQDGATGLALDGQVSLGTIDLPADPTETPLQPGDDADSDLDDLVDVDVTARVDGDGVPVGLPSCGKGDDAQGQVSQDQLADADQDGLIDVLDADDNGNGIVDDFEGNGEAGGMLPGIRANFFMNLKVYAEQAQPYYSGTTAEIAAALSTDTIITFEVQAEPSATTSIAAAHLLDVPGPAYLSIAQKSTEATDGLDLTLWSASNYAFDEESDRFDAFVCPNAVMDAGDTFTVEVSLDDGTTEQYSRMINYIFKNIPKLIKYGSAGALTNFDVTDAGVNGTNQHPIPFDGSKDLVLVYQPPPDENGDYLTNLYYTFGIFYHAANGTQLNDQIDEAATWPSRPAGFGTEGTSYLVLNDDLTLAGNNTYTVALPKEIFPDQVQTASGPVDVAQYKIDITAECTSGNAAIMLAFEKQ